MADRHEIVNLNKLFERMTWGRAGSLRPRRHLAPVAHGHGVHDGIGIRPYQSGLMQ